MKLSCGWDDKRWTFVSQEPAASPGTSSFLASRRSIPDPSGLESTLSQLSARERPLDRTAFEAGSVGHFWDRYVPSDTAQGVGGVYAGYWIKTIQDLAIFDETANIALQATALTALGRQNSDAALLRDGTRLYARALHETNKALQDAERAQSDAILASCKLLSMYENFRVDSSNSVSTQGQDW